MRESSRGPLQIAFLMEPNGKIFVFLNLSDFLEDSVIIALKMSYNSVTNKGNKTNLTIVTF